MRTIFSTADVPQVDAFDALVDFITRQIGPPKMEPVARNFHAELSRGTLAGLGLTSWRFAPVVSRHVETDDLCLLLPQSRLFMQFPDYDMELNSGSLCLLDFHHKHHVTRAVEPIEQTIVRIPRELLARRIRITRDVVNRPVPLLGDAALLRAFVRDLVRIGPSTLSPAAAAIVREQTIDLTAVVLGDRTGTMPRLGAAARFGTLKLRVFIESQLTNPDADAQSIAAGAGVGERHANRLLALEGTSIRRLLIERRLSKCREMIEDPQLLHRSISDIAFFYGFRHLSHFTRVFKERFGLSPREYRSTFDPAGH